MNVKDLKVNCYILELKNDPGKDGHLNPNEFVIKYIETYEESFSELLRYFSTPSKLFGVKKIYRQGSLIRPQFSGHRKKYERAAIGLTISIEAYDKTRNIVLGKPLNADELKKDYKYSDIIFKVNKEGLIKNVAWFIDLSQIYPFSLIRVFKILYNPNISYLKDFLSLMYSKYEKSLKETFKHLKVPSTPTVSFKDLDQQPNLVLYRCQRSFVSSVITYNTLKEMFTLELENDRIDKLILSNTVSYFIVEDENIAYYYSAVLNYLVYKINQLGGSYILNQYGRPIQAIKIAGLEWKNKDWQILIAEKAKKLHNSARKKILKYLELPENIPYFEFLDGGKDIIIKEKLGSRIINIYNNVLMDMKETTEITKNISDNIDKHSLLEALNIVATFADYKRNNALSKPLSISLDTYTKEKY